MSITDVRERSVSITVPAPPPPSPRHDTGLGIPASIVTAIDLQELLQLLHLKTNAFVTSPSESPIVTAPPSPSLLALSVATSPSEARTDAEAGGYEHEHEEVQEADDGQEPEALKDTNGPEGTKETERTEAVDGTKLALEETDVLTETDAGDESLQRYKQSLGLGGGKDLSDPSDPRVCIIKSLTMETPGRDPVTIDLSVPGSEATLKDHPFKIKEGSRFTMVATFKVQHEVLSGLRYVQIVKRKGIRVSKDSEMIGSYAPSTDKQPLYTKRFQEDEAPTGMLARGHYQAISSFVDDDKKTHLEFEWSFDISKDW